MILEHLKYCLLIAISVIALLPAPLLGAERSNEDSPKPTTSTNAPLRFDYLVREDFFAGAAGDAEAMKRAMNACKKALLKNPKDAEPMVWHGSGLLSMGGQAFRTGDVPKGIELWQRGLKEMDKAVALDPDNISVLIPRGATLLPVSQYSPDPKESKRLLQTGVNDYEKILRLQTAYFSTLSTHSRGELLFGLADGWFRLNNLEKSKQYLRRITKDCAGSVYAQRAASWLATSDLTILRDKSKTLTCTGCHAD